MNDPKPPELFAERPVRSDFARGARRGPSYAMRRVITLFVICIIIGSGLYYWKNHRATPSAPEQIPTIKAEGNYKQRPEHPGGIDIPHQDVQVYQSLDNKNAPPPVVEHLLPPPEVPQSNTVAPRPTVVINDAPAALESLTPPAAKIETTASQLASTTPQPSGPTAAPSASATAAAVAPVVPTPAAAPAPQPAAVSKAATKAAQANLDQVFKDIAVKPDSATTASTTDVENAPSTVLPAGTTAIQLASIPDKASAQSALNKLQTQYASLLKPTQLRLVKADLGAKGIYYRIQSQPVSEDRAKSLCSALKANKAGCILVRP